MLPTGPSARRGHSLVLYNETKVILFGGRGNDAHRRHVPKRFHVEEEQGVLDFTTHDGYPLSSSYSPDSARCQPVETCTPLQDDSSGSEEVCSYSWEHLFKDNPSPTKQAKIEETCGFSPVFVMYNDVWLLDTDCLRYGDLACANDGLRILHEGLTFGGCNSEQGELVCETPSERYGHGAAMLNETTMAICGGYSHECEDYCDDLWLFDLVSLHWTKVESTLNPGYRRDFSLVSDFSSLYLFGGHRLWNGFSNGNLELPKEGYLEDLWRYGADETGQFQWSQLEKKTTCVDAPGLTWESRNDKKCTVHWPSPRSGHAAVYDKNRGGIWLHGGYSTYYPYPTSKDPGSGIGTRSVGREHIALHPTYAFYLDDLWFFDLESGYWEKKRICELLKNDISFHIMHMLNSIDSHIIF